MRSLTDFLLLAALLIGAGCRPQAVNPTNPDGGTKPEPGEIPKTKPARGAFSQAKAKAETGDVDA